MPGHHLRRQSEPRGQAGADPQSDGRTLDATDLSGTAQVTNLTNPTLEQTIIYVLPFGRFGIQMLPGGVNPGGLEFAIDADGLVSYDDSLEEFVLTGAGTSTIEIVGHEVTVDSTHLDVAVWVFGVGAAFGPQFITRHLPIGEFILRVESGGLMHSVEPGLFIKVEADGSLVYPFEFDGTALAGLGTNALVALPFPMTVDAEISTSSVLLGANPNLFVASGASETFALPVGDFLIFASPGGGLGSVFVTRDGCDSIDFFFGSGQTISVTCGVISVTIDIKPGSDPNSVNICAGGGIVTVAVLSTDTFDATTIDPDSARLAETDVRTVGKSNKQLAHEEDVDGDGLLDLVMQFPTVDLALILDVTDTEAVAGTGRT